MEERSALKLVLPDPPPVPAELCIRCKGAKALCGQPCYILAALDKVMPKVRITKAEVFGPSPPALFVGRYGYPNVNVGPLLPPFHLPQSEAAELNDPLAWFGQSIPEIIGKRSSLVRSRSVANVKRGARGLERNKVLEVAQELAMADRPADTEVHLRKVPKVDLSPRLETIAPPMGPGLDADWARLAENTSVPRKVDALVSDTDVRAGVASLELYRSGFDPYYLVRLLSAGLLGRKQDRRLVPTRWAITATDDILGKRLMEKVKEFPVLDRIEYFTANYVGNHFHVLLLPRVWGFDMVESWQKGAVWAADTAVAHDWEEYKGRTSYADNITGAYYAARLSILEHLVARGRQALPVVYREITPDYWAELGVWVIRETVRKAMAAAPLVFESTKAAVDHTAPKVRNKEWPLHTAFLRPGPRQSTLPGI